ncbi:bifunctional 2-C-methyl-D-erythritol 4-phosphate cytidylyltransferase/2-C-methyl-D-erythritol 2,4-cyclodiphosphate synthase [Sphingomonas sp.]|uniref:bifunctional 2-C-methyl-D-erythritol 4-phosphate cytidylyltransferase/2-C-methyl-D-erythritol 2,4-cyclodiphosphate synthase n=1 Tax=Sphingomonas sp. TaxID=28214 RepID=UPI003AFF7303
MTTALIVAAGSGSRAGGALPKQFQPVAGRPMLRHAVEAFRHNPAIDAVVVVVAVGQEDFAREAVDDVRLVIGGATRRESVANGLKAVETARVLVHDAARPFVPAAVIDRVLAALDDAPGVTPVLPVADTLVRGEALLGEVVPRDGVWRVQTPQGFDTATLRRAHAAWDDSAEASDDAQMVRRLGLPVALVQGDPMLDKVTQPQDFAAAEARAGWEWRSATGFDVHRLEAGEELWLGGVLVPHDRGLSGHSDADVALHALTDALLGTIAAGDIGTHFPPSDPQWKGAASHRFLTHAAELIAAKGGQIAFVDLTIICEAPKIGPHRAGMQARIAALLGLSPERVSIKATTTERLGFTGRGEGIAAQASATVRLPGWTGATA